MMRCVDFLSIKLDFPRKKTSLGESLAGSHAYNPIRDSFFTSVVRSSQKFYFSTVTILDEVTEIVEV